MYTEKKLWLQNAIKTLSTHISLVWKRQLEMLHFSLALLIV